MGEGAVQTQTGRPMIELKNVVKTFCTKDGSEVTAVNLSLIHI